MHGYFLSSHWIWNPAQATVGGRRIWRRSRLWATLGSVVLIAWLAGCSRTAPDQAPSVAKGAPAAVGGAPEAAATAGDQSAAVEAVGRAFVDAAKTGNAAGVRAVLTKKAQEIWENDSWPTSSPDETYRFANPIIEGDKAALPVTIVDKEGETPLALRLRREDGQWRVWGMALGGTNLNDGLAMDLEDPEKEITADEMPEGMMDMKPDGKPGMPSGFGLDSMEPAGKLPLPPEALSSEAFTAGWQANMEVKEQPAREVITQLAQGLGLVLQDTAGLDDALSQPLTGKLAQQSKLWCIEAACRRAGAFPEFSATGINLKKGTRPHAAAFAGPFVIEAQELERQPGTGTGTINVTVRGFGLPPGVAPNLSTDSVSLEAVVGPDEQSLLDSVTRSGPMEPPADGTYEVTIQLDLKNLLRSVTAIREIRGKIKVPIPTRVENLDFAQLTPGATVKSGTAEIKLTEVQREEGTVLSFEVSGADPGKLEWTPQDAQGEPLETTGGGTFTFGNSGSRELYVDGNVARLSVQLPGSSQAVRIDAFQPGQTTTLGSARLKLQNIQRTSRYNLGFLYQGIASMRVVIVPRNAQGQPLPVSSQGQFSGMDQGGETLSVQEQPASVRAAVVSAVEEVTFDFALKDLPLKPSPLAPERIEPVQFPGHDTPVTIEFVKLDRTEPNFPKVTLRVINHANKPIRTLHMKHFYLDASGKTLQDFPSSHSDRPHVVGANTEQEIDTGAYFMPPETQTVRAVPEGVTFTDATQWKAQK